MHCFRLAFYTLLEMGKVEIVARTGGYAVFALRPTPYALRISTGGHRDAQTTRPSLLASGMD